MTAAIGPGTALQAVRDIGFRDDPVPVIRAGSTWIVSRMTQGGVCAACDRETGGFSLCNDPIPVGTPIQRGLDVFQHGGWCFCGFRVVGGGEALDVGATTYNHDKVSV